MDCKTLACLRLIMPARLDLQRDLHEEWPVLREPAHMQRQF